MVDFFALRCGLRGQFEANRAGENQRDAEDALGRGGFSVAEDADGRAADRADAGPYGVGRAHRQRFHRQRQEKQADGKARKHPDEDALPLIALPAVHHVDAQHFQQARDDQIKPFHLIALLWRARRCDQFQTDYADEQRRDEDELGRADRYAE